MPALYQSSVRYFLSDSRSNILGLLSRGYAAQGFEQQRTEQTETWDHDIDSLQSSLSQACHLAPTIENWAIILEFVIPRKGKRIDVVLLAGDAIVILELKSGTVSTEASRQIEEYALLLHYFHKPSFKRRILPFVISPIAFPTYISVLLQRNFAFDELPSTWIAPTNVGNWSSLAGTLQSIATLQDASDLLAAESWVSGAYHPVPTIVDAALSLRNGLQIREIAHSEASEHEIQDVTHTLQRLVIAAKTKRQFHICFLTGVPGSGKTLVGLSLAHSKQSDQLPIHFMSGNGPLVKVLQHLFTQQAMRNKVPATQAKIEARTLIENVHLFAKHYSEEAPTETPSNHVIIFDEAQRAWNRKQNFRKFRRDYSEPQMLLSIMERHPEWACVIALVGGGQEINDGEAGLEEWGSALRNSRKNWHVFASPEVIDGGESTAGHRLFDTTPDTSNLTALPELHLRTSNRSLRAEDLSRWVNAVIAGNALAANELRVNERFPLYLTRSLKTMRQTLKQQSLGESRYGLAGSSGAARLRAEGLEPDSAFHNEYPWEHWYLASKADVRSSFQCEVFATEFEIQGLELDWIGLCWGGDFIWHPASRWLMRKFRPGSESKWSPIKSPDRRSFRENAYRVLLTRARQGLVIFVPTGDPNDPTRDPQEFGATAQFLLECGVRDIDASPLPTPKLQDAKAAIIS